MPKEIERRLTELEREDGQLLAALAAGLTDEKLRTIVSDSDELAHELGYGDLESVPDEVL